jgi:hypothetical protein
VKINGNKESSQETSKEDRKEEISFPHTREHIIWAGGEILQPSFCGLPKYKTLF